MIKFLIKIWPAFIPVILYFSWVLISRKMNKKKQVLDGEYQVVGEGKTTNKSQQKPIISLENKVFVIMLYSSLILAILTLVLSALLVD